MTACKDLKERILNSEEYKSKQKKKEDETKRLIEMQRMRREILDWFIGLPHGRYRIYGEKKILRYDYKHFIFGEKIPITNQKSWIVNYYGVEAYFAFDFDNSPPNEDEIEWIYNNQEQVCKGIKFLG